MESANVRGPQESPETQGDQRVESLTTLNWLSSLDEDRGKSLVLLLAFLACRQGPKSPESPPRLYLPEWLSPNFSQGFSYRNPAFGHPGSSTGLSRGRKSRVSTYHHCAAARSTQQRPGTTRRSSSCRKMLSCNSVKLFEPVPEHGELHN